MCDQEEPPRELEWRNVAIVLAARESGFATGAALLAAGANLVTADLERSAGGSGLTGDAQEEAGRAAAVARGLPQPMFGMSSASNPKVPLVMDALRLLLAGPYGAEYASNCSFYSPLQWTARRTDVAALRCLLSAGANPNSVLESGRKTLLHAAIREALKLERVSREMQEYLSVLFEAGAKVEGPELRAAAAKGRADIVELLLAKCERENDESPSPIVDAVDHSSCTALHFASNEETALLLIMHGANVHARDSDYLTPLHLVEDAGKARVLVAHGADLNARDTRHRTPLHLVTDLEAARTLIALGADVNARNDLDESPLHISCFTSAEEMVRLLLGSGADANARDKHGRTPLHWAGEDGDPDGVVAVLIAAGADVNVRDADGRTPLHELSHSQAAVRMLLKAGADVNARDKHGRTPLHEAKDDVAATLIAAGGKDDADADDTEDDTPLVEGEEPRRPRCRLRTWCSCLGKRTEPR